MAFVNSISQAVTVNQATATTAAVDMATGGANLLLVIIAVTSSNTVTNPVVTDSSGNPYTKVGRIAVSGTQQIVAFVATNPVTTTTMTATATWTGNVSSSGGIIFLGYSGRSGYIGKIGSINGASSTTQNLSQYAPTVTGSDVICGIALNAARIMTAGSGWTVGTGSSQAWNWQRQDNISASVQDSFTLNVATTVSDTMYELLPAGYLGGSVAIPPAAKPPAALLVHPAHPRTRPLGPFVNPFLNVEDAWDWNDEAGAFESAVIPFSHQQSDVVVGAQPPEDPWWDEQGDDDWWEWQEDSGWKAGAQQVFQQPAEWWQESDDDTADEWENYEFDSGRKIGDNQVFQQPGEWWQESDDDIADEWDLWQDDSQANRGFVDQPPDDGWYDAWFWDDDIDDEWPVEDRPQDTVVAADQPPEDPFWDDEVGDEWEAWQDDSQANAGFVDQPPADPWDWIFDDVEDELAAEEIIPEELFEEQPPADAWDQAFDDIEDEPWWFAEDLTNTGFVDVPPADAWDGLPWAEETDDEPWWFAEDLTNPGFVDVPPADPWWWDDVTDDELAADEFVSDDFEFEADQSPEDPFVEDDAGDDWWVDDYQLIDNNPVLSGEDAWVYDDLDAADPWEEWQFDSGIGADNNPVITVQTDEWDWWEQVDDEWGEEQQPVGADAVVTTPGPEDAWDWTDLDTADEWDTWQQDSAANPGFVDVPPADPWWWDEDVSDEFDSWQFDSSVPVEDQPSADAWPWDSADDLDDELVLDAYLQVYERTPEDPWPWFEEDATDELPEDVYLQVYDQPAYDPWWPWDDTDDELWLDERPPEIAVAAQPPEDAWDWSETDLDDQFETIEQLVPDFVQVQASQDEWPWEDDLDDQWELETAPVVPDVIPPPPAAPTLDATLLRPSRRNVRFKWGFPEGKPAKQASAPVAKLVAPSGLLKKLLERAASGIETTAVTTALTSAPRGAQSAVFVKRRADEDHLQVWRTKAAWAALLPAMPRGVHALLAAIASADRGAAAQGQLSELRRRVSEAGQDQEEALRAVFRSGLADAPQRLQQAFERYLALPALSPERTRAAKRHLADAGARLEHAEIRRLEADLEAAQRRRKLREKRLALAEQLARKRLDRIGAAVEQVVARFARVEEKLEAARKQSAIVAALHKKLARAAEKGQTRQIVEGIEQAREAETTLRGIHADLLDLQGALGHDRQLARLEREHGEAELARLREQHRQEIERLEADMRRQRNNLLAIQTAVKLLLDGD